MFTCIHHGCKKIFQSRIESGLEIFSSSFQTDIARNESQHPCLWYFENISETTLSGFWNILHTFRKYFLGYFPPNILKISQKPLRVVFTIFLKIFFMRNPKYLGTYLKSHHIQENILLSRFYPTKYSNKPILLCKIFWYPHFVGQNIHESQIYCLQYLSGAVIPRDVISSSYTGDGVVYSADSAE